MERYSAGPCTVARALLRVGDAWSVLILRDAGYGATRFDQFRTSLGIAPNILTRRLAALTQDGLLAKRRYSERPPRDEYVLTPKGRDFLPVLAVMNAWGQKYHGEGAVSQLVDAESGAPIDAVVVDRATGRPLSEIATRLVMPEAG